MSVSLFVLSNIEIYGSFKSISILAWAVSVNIRVSEARPLGATPSFFIITVLAAMVIISLLSERLVRGLTAWLETTTIHYLNTAIGGIKNELTLLGAISILLAAVGSLIPRICVPSRVFKTKFALCPRDELSAPPKNSSNAICKEI